MKENNNNLAYLLHIRDAIDELSKYTQDHTFESFDNNTWDQAAALRYLEIIGEAANKLDRGFRSLHSEIFWREIIDFRNIVIHDYINVDLNIIWKIMTDDIPKLQKDITIFLKKHDTSG